MAKLHCKDGTVINISMETEKELRKAFGNNIPDNIPDNIRVGMVFKVEWEDVCRMLIYGRASDWILTNVGDMPGYRAHSTKGYDSGREMRNFLVKGGYKYVGMFNDVFCKKNG